LRRSTSINSIFETHKEKEMADFRKLFYALAIVALLAGLTIPASAQAPFVCQTNTGAPPLLRGEGYTELVGDIILSCTGGVPTAAGQVVPQANFTIFLNTNVTSRLLTTNGVWTEALLIVDEPHSPTHPAINITNCGLPVLAPDTPTAPGICSITSDGFAGDTYNGTAGHPNVFQARVGSFISATQLNALTWAGVPIDPPGTTSRTFRFTNIRANATSLIGSILPSSTFTTTYVQAQISVSGNTTMSINNPQQIVGYVLRGLTASGPLLPSTFLQCTGVNTTFFPPVGTGTSLTTTYSSSIGALVTLTEGFQTSWKARNISEVLNNSIGGGGVTTGYNGTTTSCGTGTGCGDYNQNVPGAIYYTESGFEYGANGAVDPTPNPPPGTSSGPITSTANAFSDANTGITQAGYADSGTRLALQIAPATIPSGTTANPFVVLVPAVIPLISGGVVTGVAVLTSTDANGAGKYTPPGSLPSVPTASLATQSTLYVPLQSSGLVVYEVLYADPFLVESATIPVLVAYNPSLASNTPTPGLTTTAVASFAPFYSTAAAALPSQAPSTGLPIPRFTSLLSSFNLFSVVKCACDVLFPYVSAGGGYDTGIAIANTSLDPGAAFGFFGVPQSGSVEFWYYGNGTTVPPQCTNTTSPGTCPGTTVVNPGQVLTYVLSTGSAQWGLDNRAAAFTGYIIAQAQFQYCHAFAFLGALGAGPTSPGISEGYLGLIMSNGSGITRVLSPAESFNQ
jgi:hypothetical protein